MNCDQDDIYPLIRVMRCGKLMTEEGKTLGNCMLGINHFNHRLATIAESVVILIRIDGNY